MYKVSGDGCGIQSRVLLWGMGGMLMHNCDDSVTRPEELLAARRLVKYMQYRWIGIRRAFPTWHGTMFDTGGCLRREVLRLRHGRAYADLWHWREINVGGCLTREDLWHRMVFDTRVAFVCHEREFDTRKDVWQTREDFWHGRIFDTGICLTREDLWHGMVFDTRVGLCICDGRVFVTRGSLTHAQMFDRHGRMYNTRGCLTRGDVWDVRGFDTRKCLTQWGVWDGSVFDTVGCKWILETGWSWQIEGFVKS